MSTRERAMSACVSELYRPPEGSEAPFFVYFVLALIGAAISLKTACVHADNPGFLLLVRDRLVSHSLRSVASELMVSARTAAPCYHSRVGEPGHGDHASLIII